MFSYFSFLNDVSFGILLEAKRVLHRVSIEVQFGALLSKNHQMFQLFCFLMQMQIPSNVSASVLFSGDLCRTAPSPWR